MSERPHILVMGAGAVGAYVGAYLLRAGVDLTFADPWPEHVDRMRTRGLELVEVAGAEGFTVPAPALHLAEVQSLWQRKPIDIALLCMKSYDTAWSVALIHDYLAPEGFVVSLQNGVNEEIIAGVVGRDRTLGCIASRLTVDLIGPGLVRREVPRGSGHKVFRVGEVDGRETARVRDVAERLGAVDECCVTTNLSGERWSKLVVNAMRNAISAATGLSGNDCDREPLTRWLAIRVGAESVRIGHAQGLELETIEGFSPDEWTAAADGDVTVRDRIEQGLLADTKGSSESARPSMGQDVLKGRRTEIDHLNGLVVAKGEAAGIEAPANAALVEVVRAIERGEIAPSLDAVASI